MTTLPSDRKTFHGPQPNASCQARIFASRSRTTSDTWVIWFGRCCAGGATDPSSGG